MSQPTLYPIHEMFHTFQGEGVHMGRPAFFVRTFGCPVHCPWCDSAGTWHKDWVPSNVERMSAQGLVQAALLAGMRDFVGCMVVTGGEPAVHNLKELVDLCRVNGIQIHLETSGAFEINGDFDWVTLSPKRWKPPIASSVAKANEFKLIIEHPDDITFYFEMLVDQGLEVEFGTGRYPDKSIWLHPEWSQRENEDVLNAITRAVKTGSGIFRAGWQLHKLYRSDAMDARSRPLVPLGGDKAKGY